MLSTLSARIISYLWVSTVRVESSNGGIDLTLPAGAQSAVRAHTSNNGITLHLPGDVNARLVAGTSNGSITTTALVEAAVQANIPIRTLSVQNTTLDDVFVHYTGRQLRDELVKAHQFVMPPRPGMQP